MPKDKEPTNWDDLEVFTSKGVRIRDTYVTILSNFQIHFNAGFCHRASIGDKSHIIIAYSRQNKSIVFQFTSDEKAIGVLKLIQRSGIANVGSRSFFNTYDLDPKALKGRYIPIKGKIPKIGEAWFINLDSKLPVHD